MIRAQGLSIGWGGVPLLENLDFEIGEGEVFAILGGSGCGKSTLLRHLIGLERPIAGTIRIDGFGDPAELEGAPHFGVLFQSGALFGSMTVGENVALPLEKWTSLPKDAIDTVVRSTLHLVGLAGFEDHLPSEISGGMKKRAGIARSLALGPKLLFLDEPSAGLDPVTSVELDDLILTLNRALGMTTVIVTHELASIFRIASEFVMLDRDARGIIARGDPHDVTLRTQDARVASFFNREARGR